MSNKRVRPEEEQEGEEILEGVPDFKRPCTKEEPQQVVFVYFHFI